MTGQIVSCSVELFANPVEIIASNGQSTCERWFEGRSKWALCAGAEQTNLEE